MTAQKGLFGGRKVREGKVVSDRMEKTIVVAVQSNIRHRLYKKTIRRVRKFMAHDEDGVARLGDQVRIAESAPISKRKRWRLVEVIEKAELPEVAPESIDLELLGEVKKEEAEEPAAAPPAPAAVIAAAPTAIAEPAEPTATTGEQVATPEAAVEEPAQAEEAAAEASAEPGAPAAAEAAAGEPGPAADAPSEEQG